MPISFITYHSIPSSSNPEHKIIKGAYINGWIDADSISEAQKIAFAKIKELDWQVISIEESKEVSREFYRYNPEGLEKFEQASIDKEVYTIHTYISEDDE